MLVSKIVAFGRVQFKKVKKRVKAEYKMRGREGHLGIHLGTK